MSVFNTGHQRNNSAGEHLIGGNNEDCETAGPYAETVYSDGHRGGVLPSMRYSAAVSDDCSSFYGPSAYVEEEEEYKGCLCKDPNLRANIRVIIGSILLTIIGILLFSFGIFVMFFADIDIQPWIFFLTGVLFFIPGFYHVVYISCTALERPGWNINELPTFRRPPR